MNVLVFGTGIEFALVQALAEAGHQVYYYTDYLAPFPSFEDFGSGIGFSNIQKVHTFFDYVDKVDKIVSFDCYGGDVLEFLRSKGYDTFGGGRAVELELNRKLLKLVLKGVGVSQPDYKVVKGFDKIKPPAVVKLNIFRGSAETFTIQDEAEKRNIEVQLKREFGEFLNKVEFVVEQILDKDKYVEFGFDAVYNDGFQFPMLFGLEYKKGAYIGKVINALNELPSGFQDMILRLDLVLRKMRYKGFISAEAFLNPKQQREYYFLDITMRPPYPLGLGYRYAIQNFADVVLNDAKPVYRGRYYVAIPFNAYVKDYYVYVKFPERDKRYNFNALMKVDGHYYIPKGSEGSGCICEVFNELNKERMKSALERLTEKLDGVEIRLSEFDEAYEEVRRLWRGS